MVNEKPRYVLFLYQLLADGIFRVRGFFDGERGRRDINRDSFRYEPNELNVEQVQH